MTHSELEKEILERLGRFQHRLDEEELDGALIVQKADILYLTGTDQDAHLWVPVSGSPVLMVRKSLERAREDSPLDRVIPLTGFSQIPDLIEEYSEKLPVRLGLEMDILPASFYIAYAGLFPGADLIDISSIIRGIRMVKSEYEIHFITKAAEMADEMYKRVPSFLFDSATETDLALRVENCYRSLGHPGIVRTRGFNTECHYGHILAGRSAAASSNSPGPTGGRGMGHFFSQGAGLEAILPDEPVIVDYAASIGGYVADQSRVFCLGKLEKDLVEAHNVMIQVQGILSQKGLPGVMAGDLYETAMDMVENAGLSRGFMGYPDPVPFIGHGIGLELDEWPVIGRGSKTILEPGMVIAMEPKVIFPEKGAVGIENVLVVTDKGLKKLNKFPDEICFVNRRP